MLEIVKDMSSFNASGSVCHNLIMRLCGTYLEDNYSTPATNETFDNFDLFGLQSNWGLETNVGAELDTFNLWSSQMNTNNIAWGGGNFDGWNTGYAT